MRRAILLLALLWACPAAADQPSMTLSADREVTFEMAFRDQARHPGWQVLNPDRPEKTVSIPLQARDNPAVDFRWSAHNPWFIQWTGHLENYKPVPGAWRDVTTERGLDPVRCTLAIVPVLLAVTGCAVLFKRRGLESEGRAEALQQEISEITRVDQTGAPQQIGRYKVLSTLGRGGMATVYEVSDDTGARFALKYPLPSLLQDEDMRRRLGREIRLGMTLSHPRLVRMLDVGPEDEPWLVMELVEGKTLDQAPPDGPHQALELAIEVLSGLEVIHERGVIHRDLKPSNLMRDPHGHVKIMDFGVAHDRHTQATRLTASDQILGTPIYMAPEQLRSNQVDPRSDLYSLGLILYEQLTGSLPYQGDVFSIITQKLGQPLPPLVQVCPQLPKVVCDVVMQLLEEDAADRYPTAAAARQALTDALALL